MSHIRHFLLLFASGFGPSGGGGILAETGTSFILAEDGTFLLFE